MSTQRETFLTPEEVCIRWRNFVSTKTLGNWRWRGRGPKATKLGGKVMYALDDIIAYERRNTVGGGL